MTGTKRSTKAEQEDKNYAKVSILKGHMMAWRYDIPKKGDMGEDVDKGFTTFTHGEVRLSRVWLVKTTTIRSAASEALVDLASLSSRRIFKASVHRHPPLDPQGHGARELDIRVSRTAHSNHTHGVAPAVLAMVLLGAEMGAHRRIGF